MSEGRKTDGKDKGSWEVAFEEYQETWLRDTGGVGFFTFGSSVECKDTPTECSSVRNARVSFRTLMTFATRKRIAYGATVERDKPPTASLRFAPQDWEEEEAGRGLIAELIFRLAHTDEKYFSEIVRLKKAFDSMGINRNELSAKSALYLIACDLLAELGRDPTREEVLERLYSTTRHRPRDTSSLFRESKLAFLIAKMGRPPKVRNRKDG